MVLIRSNRKKGRPKVYSDEAILCALIIREVYKLPLRMLQGFLISLFALLELNLPSYSQISRRSAHLNKKLKKFFKRRAKDIVFDYLKSMEKESQGSWKK